MEKKKKNCLSVLHYLTGNLWLDDQMRCCSSNSKEIAAATVSTGWSLLYVQAGLQNELNIYEHVGKQHDLFSFIFKNFFLQEKQLSDHWRVDWGAVSQRENSRTVETLSVFISVYFLLGPFWLQAVILIQISAVSIKKEIGSDRNKTHL